MLSFATECRSLTLAQRFLSFSSFLRGGPSIDAIDALTDRTLAIGLADSPNVDIVVRASSKLSFGFVTCGVRNPVRDNFHISVSCWCPDASYRLCGAVRPFSVIGGAPILAIDPRNGGQLSPKGLFSETNVENDLHACPGSYLDLLYWGVRKPVNTAPEFVS